MKKRLDGETQQQRRERFVRVWQAAESLAVVAEAMGVTKNTAKTFAVYLRRIGVPLKRFRPKPEAATADELARLKALCDGKGG